MDLTNTQDNTTRRVSLTKVYGERKGRSQVVIGWEHGPPREGEPYEIYLGRGKTLKTSRVQVVEEAPTGLMIRTANSLYQLEYL